MFGPVHDVDETDAFISVHVPVHFRASLPIPKQVSLPNLIWINVFAKQNEAHYCVPVVVETVRRWHARHWQDTWLENTFSLAIAAFTEPEYLAMAMVATETFSKEDWKLRQGHGRELSPQPQR